MIDKDLLLLSLNEKWQCSLPFGWIPITSDEIIPHTEIYDSSYFAYYLEDTKSAIKSLFDATVIFEIREDGELRSCHIDDSDFAYDGLEYIYTNIALDFVLYFSHEQSTTVGGQKLIEEITACGQNMRTISGSLRGINKGKKPRTLAPIL